MTKLKGSRDKLLEQIDKQWEEVDRLGLEYKATSDELASTRRLASNWEAQAQDSLAHIDRLKVRRAVSARILTTDWEIFRRVLN